MCVISLKQCQEQSYQGRAGLTHVWSCIKLTSKSYYLWAFTWINEDVGRFFQPGAALLFPRSILVWYVKSELRGWEDWKPGFEISVQLMVNVVSQIFNAMVTRVEPCFAFLKIFERPTVGPILICHTYMCHSLCKLCCKWAVKLKMSFEGLMRLRWCALSKKPLDNNA